MSASGGAAINWVRDRCAGSDAHVWVHAERLGPNHAACPECGRRTAFDRITGRFHRHLVPAPSGVAAAPDGTPIGPESD